MHHFILYIALFYGLMFFVSIFSVHKALNNKKLTFGYFFISIEFLIYFFYFWNSGFKGVWSLHQQYSFGFLLSWLLFMTIVSLFTIAETIIRFLFIPFRWKQPKKMPSRPRFVSILAMCVGTIIFSGMIYGMFVGKYDFKVKKHTLYFEDLPDSFDGYRIAHISDIHAGSFDNPEKVQKGINLINEQKSDVIFFTGDLVNNTADEVKPWIHIFRKLSAPDGVFSVLGNHDYGDYVKWSSPQMKVQNLRLLKNYQKEMGFNLLLNEAVFINRNDERIAIVGVENWGKGFIQKGNLKKATQNVENQDFKILLSHDPTHWQYKVNSFVKKIHLTLSGHTHGMQFGLEIPDLIKWSPSQWRYEHWGGIYQKNDIYLNVNRGFGYLAFPGRVGMPPEITIIELRKKFGKTK